MFHEHGQQFLLDLMTLEKATWERLLISINKGDLLSFPAFSTVGQ
jgi:hypothetical protein